MSTVISLLDSRNRFEMLWPLGHDVFSCWKHRSEDGYMVITEGWTSALL